MNTFFTFLFLIFTFSVYSQENKLIINYQDNTTEEYQIDGIKEVNIVDGYVAVEDFYFRSLYFILSVGNTRYIDYVFVPENASNQKIIWEVEKPEIASVNDSGLVRALKPGTTEIYGTSEELGRKLTFVLDVEGPTSVNLTKEDIKIYPNPTQNILNIDLNINNFEVIINDIEGKVLYSAYDSKSINISEFTPASYFLTLVINNKYFNFNFVKI